MFGKWNGKAMGPSSYKKEMLSWLVLFFHVFHIWRIRVAHCRQGFRGTMICVCGIEFEICPKKGVSQDCALYVLKYMDCIVNGEDM